MVSSSFFDFAGCEMVTTEVEASLTNADVNEAARQNHSHLFGAHEMLSAAGKGEPRGAEPSLPCCRPSHVTGNHQNRITRVVEKRSMAIRLLS